MVLSYNKNMKEMFLIVYEFIINSVSSSSMWGPIFACFLIVIESIIPVLPLFVFITIIFLAYGNIIGFLVSWICTCLGCFLSYTLVKLFTKKFIKPNNEKLNKIVNIINKISFSELVMLIAIPFTPAFLINIAAGITNMDKKRFILSIMIGKVSLVLFWGFIGTSLIDSLKDPIILIKIAIMVMLAYIASKILSKKLKIE